ncbi:MAG: AAA family ATPase [Spirochaetia bacterium]|nr:AAA family ATPase [Spirochaetia bacterium]
MKPLPIGIQTFRDIIEGGYLYIDKTQYLYNLAHNSKGAYFLSRPRRFGKSLMLSTFEEIFLGNKDLFKDLWIYNSDFPWNKYPVIRFDFSKQKAMTTDALVEFIQNQLNYIASDYSITLSKEYYYERFEELIKKLSLIGKVVILIDEYDKPIIDHLEETEKAKDFREVMKGFFTVLKGNDAYIRFLLLTGVSKFSKAGVFSNLNHLEDITMRDETSSLLGMTEEELRVYFPDYIKEVSIQEEKTFEDTLKKIKYWYNGYLFSINGVPVYNPFSFLLLLNSKQFKHHWFETGTPEFLTKLILQNNYDILEFPLHVEEIAFSSYEVDDLSLTSLLFQTGYLTIKDYDRELLVYTLDYPNFEVRQAFSNFLLRKIEKNRLSDSYLIKMIQTIQKDDLELCISHLRTIFSNIDYDLHLANEKYYQTIFYLIFSLLGMKIKAEVKTNIGRIDVVIDSNSIYILEFKLNGTKEEALTQIKTKKYYEPFLNLGKTLYLVGLEFKERNVGDYVVEEWA